MNKADEIFKSNIEKIITQGCWDENPRPKYASDGTPAHSIYITQVFEQYDIGKGEIPITTLRPIAIKHGINEIRWIYQFQTSALEVLEKMFGIMWWRAWETSIKDEETGEMVKSGTIGQRYGATVRLYDLMNKFLNGLMKDPFGRRHILSLWQENDFLTDGLNPCAFQIIGSVRKVNGVMYFDMTLIQRSSDYLVAGHINKMQYVAFMMMVAKHCGFELGIFTHFVQNLHIYDRHLEQAKELLVRKPSKEKPIFELNVPSGTSFYDITYEDFKLENYEPVKPQLKFDLGV